MCGIAGMVNMSADKQVINTMLDTMKRRGPDAQGFYKHGECLLLHSRLAIIDLEGGQQPMHLNREGESYTIVYNGELYNTDELRKTLQNLGHKFNGHSDTEVVLHAYAQWSCSCLEYFNGIFAFAVLEEKRNKLFLARDRIGVKPLFYKLHQKGMIFASEIKTLLSHNEMDARIDQEGVAQLLLLGPGRIPGSGVLQGIQELEPGCYGYFYQGKWTWSRYWKLTDREHSETFEQTAEHVRYLVLDAIQRQMVSDVPIGTFLSGGLDSSLISSVCSRKLDNTGHQLSTFSLDYVDNDQYFVKSKFQPNSDTTYIKTMTHYLNTEQHWTVLAPDALFQALDDAARARDLPGMADVDSSLLLFCGNIRKNVKVALSGECADEIFGGYPWYRDPDVRAADGFPWSQNVHIRKNFISKEFTGWFNAEEFVYDHYAQTLHSCDILPGLSEEERRIREMTNLNFRWFMQTLLDRKDRMSMYHGLEVRVPFCDYRIAEYMYSVPWSFKDWQGREKGLLRYAMRDLLPEQVLNRKKSPYPKTHDPRYFSLVRDGLRQVLDEPASPILQIVERNALESLLSSAHTWPWYGQLMREPQTIAFMLQINSWMQMYNVTPC